MLTLTGAIRTNKYMGIKKVERADGTKTNQVTFTGFSRNSKGETTAITCIYFGASDKMVKELCVPNGKVNDNGTKEYHSRLLYIQGTIAINEKPQVFPVYNGEEDEYEEVIAPSMVVYINNFEFLNSSPNNDKKENTNAEGKKETKEERKARLARQMKGNKANTSDTVEDDNYDDNYEDTSEEETTGKPMNLRQGTSVDESEMDKYCN